jgi:transposase-like protein
MSGKKLKYSEQVKRKAVQEFVSGQKSALQIADELGFKDSNRIYTWKALFDHEEKSHKIERAQKSGISPSVMKRLFELEAENEELKKSLGEKSLMIDLLKKIPGGDSVLERDVSGLSEIIKQSAAKRKRCK